MKRPLLFTSNEFKTMFITTLVVTIIVAGIVGTLITVNAEAAATTQHWHLPTGDDAWLVTEPGCNLQITEFGGSYYFKCVEDAKGGE